MRGPSLAAASGGHSPPRRAGPTIVAFHCRAQAPDAQAQQLWLTGPAAPRHVGSPQTRARTRVPCIGRQIPNHCATREALGCNFWELCLSPQLRYVPLLFSLLFQMFHLSLVIIQSAFTEHIKYAQACPQDTWHLVGESACETTTHLNQLINNTKEIINCYYKMWASCFKCITVHDKAHQPTGQAIKKLKFNFLFCR